MNVLYLQFPIVPEKGHYRKSSVWLLLPAIPTGTGYLLPSYLSENYANGAAFGTVFFIKLQSVMYSKMCMRILVHI